MRAVYGDYADPTIPGEITLKKEALGRANTS